MTKIRARLIMEILGRPPEHIKEALNTLVIKMGSEKGVKLIEQIYHDPVPVKDSKDLHTTFAEVSADFDSIPILLGAIFSYMPSNVEILEPEEVSLKNLDLTEISSRIVERLHMYDAITKKAINERELVLKKLQEVAPHLFKQPNQAKEIKEEKPAKKSKKKSKKK